MIEGVDYYFNEEGLMVFTAKYHLDRGYCCKNICKNCPWNYGRNKKKGVDGSANEKTDHKTDSN